MARLRTLDTGGADLGTGPRGVGARGVQRRSGPGARLGNLARPFGWTPSLPLRAPARSRKTLINLSAVPVLRTITCGVPLPAPAVSGKRCGEGTELWLLPRPPPRGPGRPRPDPGAKGCAGSGDLPALQPGSTSLAAPPRASSRSCRLATTADRTGARGWVDRGVCMRGRGVLLLPSAFRDTRVAEENVKEKIPPTCLSVGKRQDRKERLRRRRPPLALPGGSFGDQQQPESELGDGFSKHSYFFQSSEGEYGRGKTSDPVPPRERLFQSRWRVAHLVERKRPNFSGPRQTALPTPGPRVPTRIGPMLR